MTIEEADSELFTWELYNSAGLWQLDDALHVAEHLGYCDASRLLVRPRAGEYALMFTWPNGEKYWCHVNERLLNLIKKRINRINTRKETQSEQTYSE
jgi:hypothetical protein